MKRVYKNIVALLSICLVFTGVYGQINPAANPLASSVVWSVNPLTVNGDANITFKFGNNGSDPLPADKVEWIINIPPLVTVGSAVFAPPDGTASTGLYEVLPRTVSADGAIIIVLRSHTAIPATTFLAPQDEYTATFPVRGATIGGPTAATLHAGIVSGQASFVGNTSGDDEANETIKVVASLPVTLVSFSGSISSCKSTLVWKSAIEDGFQNYIVEYSSDGIGFSGISTVSPRGSNSTYTSSHQAAAGKAYYRLRMIDRDGSVRYSQVILLTVNCDNNAVKLYPNPAKDIVNVTINEGATTAEKVGSLYDVTGRLVLMQVLYNGSNKLNVSGLVAGVYHLNISNQQETKTYKLIIGK